MLHNPPKKLKPGDELTTSWLNKLLAIVLRNRISVATGLGAGVKIDQSDDGTVLSLATNSSGNFLCVTDGTITACTAFSGSTATAGSGTVFVCSTDSSGTITQTTNTLSVFSFSTTTGGIASGVNVWVSQDDAGNYFITAVDCGN